MGAFGLAVGGVLYFHSYQYGDLITFFSLFLVIFVMYVWWRDIVRESSYEGHHTLVVQQGIKYGMLLFIASEVCFFFSFF